MGSFGAYTNTRSWLVATRMCRVYIGHWSHRLRADHDENNNHSPGRLQDRYQLFEGL